MQDTQLFIEFYLDFIRLDDVFVFDNNIFLKEFLDKLIKRLKNLYDIYKDFIMLKNAKEYLFKLNNNQRADYQFRIFKAIFIQIITGLIKKSFIIIITTSTTRIIFVIEIIYISIIKFK